MLNWTRFPLVRIDTCNTKPATPSHAELDGAHPAEFCMITHINPTDRFSLPSNLKLTYDTVLIRVDNDRDRSKPLMKESVFLWDMPLAMKGLTAFPVIITIDSVREGANGTAVVSLHSDGLALFVCLTTRAQGRFTDNAFALRPMTPLVRLMCSICCHACTL